MNTVTVNVQQGYIHEIEADAIAVNLFQGVTRFGSTTEAVDKALNGAITDLRESGDFKAELGQTAVIYSRRAIPARRVIVVGLGQLEKFDLEAVRRASGAVVNQAQTLNIERLAIVVHGVDLGGLQLKEATQATVEGALLAAYQFNELKTADNSESVSNLTDLLIIEAEAEKVGVVRQETHIGYVVCKAVQLARDLGNRPANVATPSHLAEIAQKIAKTTNMSCEIFDQSKMRELGMGALLGVAKGSEEPPRFIILEHNAGRKDLDTIVIVGKGITFDSGGISIKPRQGMEVMKFDMMGGATVLGAMQAVGELDIPLHVVGLVPATENLPSGSANKPGDLLKALDGKTIEIISTDAEGRLVLADGLAYAQRFQPDAVIDLATLTGSSRTALGPYAMALFTNDDLLTDAVKSAAEITGERVWPLPLYQEHKDELKSSVADLKNGGESQYGGACIGAAFLSNFVGDFPWVHLDMTPIAWTQKANGYIPKGATGTGVRLLVQLLRTWVST